MTSEVSATRRSYSKRIVQWAAIAISPLPIGAAMVSGVSLPIPALGAVGFLMVSLFASRRDTPLADYVVATAMIAQAAWFTAMFAGHPWQVDTHVIFFVLLAVLSCRNSARLMMYTCGITVAHHLILAFALPQWVFPPAQIANDMARTAFHAVLIGLEGWALTFAIAQRKRVMGRVTEMSSDLEMRNAMAQQAQDSATQAEEEAHQVILTLREALMRLAGRDLTTQIESPLPDRYETLRSEFNLTVETLAEAFVHASQVAQDFSEDSQKLAKTMQSLTSTTETQARTLASASETATDLQAALAETVEQAKSAADSAMEACESAIRGGEVTNEAIEAMSGIENSSNEISKIVDLIDDVSFQTNLLALNAGVEAARAGEAGKGFMVVAAEVRQLAQSTSEAAMGIKKLIQDSTDQVSHGAELVNMVGKGLGEIQAKITEASQMTNAISEQNGAQAKDLERLHGMVKTSDGEMQNAVNIGRELSSMSRRMTVASKKLSCDMDAFNFSEEDLRNSCDEAGGRSAA
jgi:methyl-accepting chemotaxis protein